MVVGLYSGLIYAFLFCGLSWLRFKDLGTLFLLSAWGSCYLAFAAAIARSTSSAILVVIENRILPSSSEKAVIAIDRDLARRFRMSRVSLVSFLVAIVAVGITSFALHYDLKSTVKSWEIAWSCCGFFILYLTAARATFIARFYGTFAAHLKLDSDRIYELDPAHSAQVAPIASVGQRVLLFWFGIVCSVATLYPLFSHHLSWFVRFVVPTASFFSVGVGTVVFLNSERDIRSVVNGVAASTLRSTEREIAELFSRRSGLDELQWEQLQGLMSLHDKIVAAGSYRSALFSWLSILVPLVVPLVTAIVDAWSKWVPLPK